VKIHDVEQNSEEWFALRSGRPTASEFAKLVTPTGKASTQITGYAALLAAEAYAGTELERWEGNQWTQRGHELEDEARAYYTLTSGEQTSLAGFVTSDLAGCSPDHVVGDNGLAEYKCLAPQHHVLALHTCAQTGRAPNDYRPQLQGQLWVCEREWVDLVFYHPQLPVLIHRETRDEKMIELLTAQVHAVIELRDQFIETIRGAA
jgi:hypothetical protein